jgi:hypothetical protein
MDRRVARHPQVRGVCAQWHRFWLDGLRHLRGRGLWRYQGWMGAAAKPRRVAYGPSPRDCDGRDWAYEHCELWPPGGTSCGPAETHQSGPIETTFETTARNADADLAAVPAFGLVRLAVAAGFEPAEGCPSRAFEARSLGRSDTPPPERLSSCCGCANRKPARLHDRVRWTGVLQGRTHTIIHRGLRQAH